MSGELMEDDHTYAWVSYWFYADKLLLDYTLITDLGSYPLKTPETIRKLNYFGSYPLKNPKPLKAAAPGASYQASGPSLRLRGHPMSWRSTPACFFHTMSTSLPNNQG